MFTREGGARQMGGPELTADIINNPSEERTSAPHKNKLQFGLDIHLRASQIFSFLRLKVLFNNTFLGILPSKLVLDRFTRNNLAFLRLFGLLSINEWSISQDVMKETHNPLP